METRLDRVKTRHAQGFSLPMRDGNGEGSHRRWRCEGSFSLPMRDGNPPNTGGRADKDLVLAYL